MERKNKTILFPKQNIAFGQNLKKLRKEKNLTLKEVSNLTGIHITNLSQIEHGKMNICWDTQMLLCQALHDSPCHLIECPELKEIVV